MMTGRGARRRIPIRRLTPAAVLCAALMLSGASPCLGQEPSTEGLVGYWSFDEFRGHVAPDGSGQGNDALVRAARHTIVSCEEIVPTEKIRMDGERTNIPYLYVDAVVEQPFGAHPTAAYRYYDYDIDHVKLYQKFAREGGKAYDDYLRKYVLDAENFDDYLDRAGGFQMMNRLIKRMKAML